MTPVGFLKRKSGGTQGGGGVPPLNAGPGRRRGRVWVAVPAREEERPSPLTIGQGGGEPVVFGAAIEAAMRARRPPGRRREVAAERWPREEGGAAYGVR